MSTRTTPIKTLSVRRRWAEAEIRAVDARRAAPDAAAEAEHAEREAGQQQLADGRANISTSGVWC